MGADGLRRYVIDALQRGDLPPGGFSDITARDLTPQVPTGYWERWLRGARIREHVAGVPSHNLDPTRSDWLEVNTYVSILV